MERLPGTADTRTRSRLPAGFTPYIFTHEDVAGRQGSEDQKNCPKVLQVCRRGGDTAVGKAGSSF